MYLRVFVAQIILEILTHMQQKNGKFMKQSHENHKNDSFLVLNFPI